MRNRAFARITSMITERKPSSERRTCPSVYHSFEVRRGFSILLVVIFSLGPLTTLSAASEDASLPACCRRNGEHHCAMGMQGAAVAMAVPTGAAPILDAPQQCPYYPQHATVRNSPAHAISVGSVGGPGLLVRQYQAAAIGSAPLLTPVTPLTGRGPPALNLD